MNKDLSFQMHTLLTLLLSYENDAEPLHLFFFLVFIYNICLNNFVAGLGGSVGCASDWRPGGSGFDPCRGRQRPSVEIDPEIFSTVILSLLLIQEGQLSVSG